MGQPAVPTDRCGLGVEDQSGAAPAPGLKLGAPRGSQGFSPTGIAFLKQHHRALGRIIFTARMIKLITIRFPTQKTAPPVRGDQLLETPSCQPRSY